MSRIRRFRPSGLDALEARLVLSRAHQNVSVLVQTLYPGQYVLNRQQQSVAAQINQAFNQFQSDYGQARATYFASILNQPASTSPTSGVAYTAFKQYTTQRVDLLGQQLTSAFLQYSRSTAHAQGKPSTLQGLVTRYITGTTRAGAADSLNNALTSAIPQAGASAPTESLFSESQDLAIQTARAAMFNGLGILQSQYFGNTVSDQPAHN
jgi:hypothetical protein